MPISFVFVFKIICFKFNRISKISSRIPGIIENSCDVPGIRIAVIAVPSRFDKSTRRNAFPMVKPCPGSKFDIIKCPFKWPDSSKLDLTYLNFNSTVLF